VFIRTEIMLQHTDLSEMCGVCQRGGALMKRRYNVVVSQQNKIRASNLTRANVENMVSS